jgi:hypothetical protein
MSFRAKGAALPCGRTPLHGGWLQPAHLGLDRSKTVVRAKATVQTTRFRSRVAGSGCLQGLLAGELSAALGLRYGLFSGYG